MFCYLFYYLGRQNFGFAIVGIQETLQLDTTDTGIIAGGMLLCYGVGQAINGNLGDKFGARKLMFIGAVLSFVFNWLTSFGIGFWTLFIPWCLNGYVQSMGFAPGCRLIANWWPTEKRGSVFGWYLFSSGLSSILTFIASILIINHLSWEYLFRLPVFFLLFAGIVFYVIARNKPEDVGLPALPENQAPNQEMTNPQTNMEEKSWQRYLYILKNGKFFFACLSAGFYSIARYGLILWVPVYYLGEQWRANPSSIWITLALPIGMSLGSLVSGMISDRYFRSNRTMLVAITMFLTMLTVLGIYTLPAEHYIIGMVLLFFAGFFCFGASSLLFASCPDLLGAKRTGTGVGVMNAYAYGFAAVGEGFIGFMIHYTGRVNIVFLMIALTCFLSCTMALLVRQRKQITKMNQMNQESATVS